MVLKNFVRIVGGFEGLEFVGGEVGEGKVGAAVLLSEGVVAGEGGDAAGPVVEGLLVFERGKFGEDLDKDILKEVGRISVAGEVASDDGVEEGLKEVDEFSAGRFLLGFCSLKEVWGDVRRGHVVT